LLAGSRCAHDLARDILNRFGYLFAGGRLLLGDGRKILRRAGDVFEIGYHV
jgi:hypothetical protein